MKLITPENLYEFIRTGDGIDVTGPIRVLFDKKHYKDDTLDASPLFPFADREKCIVDFRRLHPIIQNEGRMYARLLIFYGAAPATAQTKINSLTLLFKEMDRLGLHADIHTLSIEDIEAVTNSNGLSEDCCYRICIVAHSILTIFKSIYKNDFFAMDMHALANLRTAHGKVIRNRKNAGKTPDIDEEFFETLDDRLPGLIWDESLPYNYRLTAAVIMLEMWVGLRRSELFRLTTDALILRRSTNGRVFSFLRYGVPKLSHGGRRMVYNETYMLPAAVSAFDALLALREESPLTKRARKKSDRLILYGDDPAQTEHLYSYYAARLFAMYFADVSVGEQKWSFVEKHTSKGFGMIYYPTITQYRVHMCGFLYQQGVKHHIVELGMSHLTSAMTTYYYRVKDRTFQTERSLIDRKIRTSINNDFDVETHAELGEQLLKELILYLSKMNVYTATFERMVAQGQSYEYEACRYAAKLKILIDTQIMPTLDYLDKRIEEDGVEAVLKTNPILKTIIPNIETIKNNIEECRRNSTPYLKNSEDIPALTRLA